MSQQLAERVRALALSLPPQAAARASRDLESDSSQPRAPSLRSDRRARWRIDAIWPLATLVAGLALTWVAHGAANMAAEEESQALFDRRADMMQSQVERRLTVAMDALRSVAAAHAMGGDATPARLQRYAQAFEGASGTALRYGLGIAQRVERETLASFVREQRRVHGPGFSVEAPSGSDELYVVTAVASDPLNRAMLGIDLGALEERRLAARQALASGELTVGQLDVNGRRGWTFLTRLDGGADRRTLAYLPLTTAELMVPVTDYSGEPLTVRLLEADGGVAYEDIATDGPIARRAVRPVEFAGRKISLEISAGARAASAWTRARLVALGGCVISVLLAALLASALVARRRTLAQVDALGGQVRRLAGMVEGARAAVIATDATGRLTWANASFEKLAGLRADELRGKTVFQLPDLEIRSSRRELARLRAAIRRDQVHHVEVEVVRGSRAAWLDVSVQAERDPSGILVGYYAIALEVTDRKVAQRRVQENEHLMRLITDNIPAHLSYWRPDGRCIFANRAFRDAFGIAPGRPDSVSLLMDEPGNPMAGRMSQNMLGRAAKAFAGEAQQFEESGVTARGLQSTWEVHLVPDATQGQVRGIFAFASNVTELRDARDAALEASRAKTGFLNSMSHEIRTPMNAVLGMLALLRKTPLTTRQADYAQKAEGAARSLLSLLNDVLDLSRIEAGRMQLHCQPFSLASMLGDLSVVLAANLGARTIELLYDLDPAVPDALVGDDMRLRQVLINLGGNAIKFTAAGEVVLRTRLVGRSEADVRVEFSVSDTGIGMSQDEVQRLCGEFVQAHTGTARKFGGSGLGLNICTKLLELMGSELEVESVPGHGSTFRFTLALPCSPQQQSPHPRPRRVLVVDDNVVARSTLAQLAHGLGWRPDRASSGEEALEMLAFASCEDDPYEAVFIDWGLPGLDGWDTSLQARSLPAMGRTPMIALASARGRESLESRAAREGQVFDGYLVKPVTGDMLREALEGATNVATGGGDGSAAPSRAVRALDGVRLLLAEDNAINQQIACELLMDQGASVDVVETGRAAVERLAQGHSYDLVLMDLLMPEMGGLEATRAIRRLGVGVPILALTANAMDTDRAECERAGMDGHLSKPIVLDDVVAAIRAHVGTGADTAAPEAAAERGSAAEPNGAEELLDRTGAVRRMAGNEALFARMLPGFEQNLLRSRQQVEQALASASQPELRETMHALKGVAATMGAMRLAARAREAEHSLREGAGDHASAARVLRVIDQTLLAVRA